MNQINQLQKKVLRYSICAVFILIMRSHVQAEKRELKDGFALYLYEQEEKIPNSLKFFQSPVNSIHFSGFLPKLKYDHRPLLKSMHQTHDFKQFYNEFRGTNKKLTVIYTLKLTVASALWQLAFDELTGGSNNLGIIFLSTGFFSSVGLNIVNSVLEALLNMRPLRSATGTLLSLFPTVFLFDGFWQIIWEIGSMFDNKLLSVSTHTLLYFLVSALFVPVQAKFSQLIDKRYPRYRLHTFKPTLSIAPLLTINYLAFGYLPSIIRDATGVSPPIAAGLGVLPAVAAWGLIDSATTSRGLNILRKEHALFSSSADQERYGMQQSISDESQFEEPTNPPPIILNSYYGVLDDGQLPDQKPSRSDWVRDKIIDMIHFSYGIFSRCCAQRNKTATSIQSEDRDDNGRNSSVGFNPL